MPAIEDDLVEARHGRDLACVGQRSLTNGVRVELAHQGTLVVGVHASLVGTDMTEGIDASKISPESVTRQVFHAVGADEVDVLADERTHSAKRRCRDTKR